MEYKDVTGQYIHEDQIRPPNGEALDYAVVERGWSLSHEAVGT